MVETSWVRYFYLSLDCWFSALFIITQDINMATTFILTKSFKSFDLCLGVTVWILIHFYWRKQEEINGLQWWQCLTQDIHSTWRGNNNVHARQNCKFCTLQDEWTVDLRGFLLTSSSHPNKWSFCQRKCLRRKHLGSIYHRKSNKIDSKGYALGHFGDSSSHMDLDSIHPSPGKKSER